MIHPGSAETPVDDANTEWVEIIADLSSDFANWRLQHLRGLWKPEVAKPVEWEWVYTWGSPAFVKAGEIYRIHSGSRARAATHPLSDDLAPGRKHVYAAGPTGAAKLIWKKADYVRLVDAFGTGDLRALFVMGENLALTNPDLSHTRRCLAAGEFLVPQEIFPTATAEVVTLLVPLLTTT